jgi:hypothetical protein
MPMKRFSTLLFLVISISQTAVLKAQSQQQTPELTIAYETLPGVEKVMQLIQKAMPHKDYSKFELATFDLEATIGGETQTIHCFGNSWNAEQLALLKRCIEENVTEISLTQIAVYVQNPPTKELIERVRLKRDH